MTAVTELLRAWTEGNPKARDRVVPLVYEELRRRAAAHLRRERAGHTLRPTALVHEAFLRLGGQERIEWKNRAQFFGVAAELMRRILVDHARGRGAGKRGGDWQRVSLDVDLLEMRAQETDVVSLDAALEALGAFDARKEKIVELRFFGGLSIEETAEVAGISAATVKREWTVARAWLYRELRSARE
jgi:RNA polymerase sigma factor (TIGR02999 family)